MARPGTPGSHRRRAGVTSAGTIAAKRLLRASDRGVRVLVDVAALGLGGIAVKAGARSAIASLWSISDEATALFVPEFVRLLLFEGASRADALRRARPVLLSDPRFSHPGFSAPNLLIGGWL